MRPRLLLLLLSSCALAPVGASDPCRGAELSLDALAAQCTVREFPRPPPPRGALRADLLPAFARARPGQPVPLRVRLTNLTAQPLELVVCEGCLAFEVAAYTPDGARADLVGDEGLGGLCGHEPPLRVVLEPGGWADKALSFSASRRRLVCQGEGCAEEPAGDLPPGEYRLEVTLPFQDYVPGSAYQVTSRTAQGRLLVAP